MRTNMKFWPAKRMLCLALCILMLVGIAMPSMDAFTWAGRESLLGRLFGVTQAMAYDSITVTYNSGDGTFESGGTTNTVSYSLSEEEITKYAHTPNISDDGSRNGGFGTYRRLKSVITIPNADSIHVEIRYGTYNSSRGVVYVIPRSYSGNITSNYGNYGQIATLSGYTASGLTASYNIEGDTATFGFWSDSNKYYNTSNDADYSYGYYAVVTGVSKVQTITGGQYLQPSPNDPEYRFKEWNTEPDGSGNTVDPNMDMVELGNGANIYAIYEEDLLDENSKGEWWKIKGDGTLIIGNGSEMTIPVNQTPYSGSNWPWRAYSSQIQSAKFIGTVHANPCTSYMFDGSSITSIDFTNYDTSNVTNMSNMFSGCSSLTSLDVSGFDTSKVTMMDYMFSDCPSLTSLDVSGFDTSNVTNMDSMFYNCTSLTSLDVSSFDTSKVTNMRNMFSYCKALTNLDISGFGTSNVIYMDDIFNGCSALTSLDVSGFDTSKVTNMNNMFSNCGSLRSLDLSGFDTSNVTSMYYMFSDCPSLTSLDVSGFDTSNVTDMRYMFNGCSKLASLDVSGFDTSNVTTMGSMFNSCQKLNTVKLGEDFAFNGKNISLSSSKALLPTPPSSTTTGKWILEDDVDGGSAMTPEQMRDAGTVTAGTWIWQEKPTKYTVIYHYNDGTENTSTEKYVAAEAATLSSTYPARFNKIVTSWNTAEDGTGTSYELGATIPANTYAIGAVVNLYAIWEDSTAFTSVSEGVYQFQIPGNAQIKLDGLPAGTVYRVSEMLPNGWILVNQSNSSGSIGPLTNSVSTFINKYMPESASAAIYATKTMDGAPATEDMAFEFTLKEGENVIQTVTAANGAVLFDPIIYTSAGTHVYTIVENWETYSGPLDASGVTFDTHVETVTVEVTDDGEGKLSAEVTYDADGPAFANRTNPGDLIITKNVVGQTAANADDTFTFTIRIKSPTGGDINSASIEIGKLPTAEQSPEPTP